MLHLGAWLTCWPAGRCQVVLDGPSQQIVYATLAQLLADARRGAVKEHVLSDTYDEAKLANDALASHLLQLEAGSSNAPRDEPHPLQLSLPSTRPEDAPSQRRGARLIRRALSALTIQTLSAIAARREMTLNSIVLGTLATHLRACRYVNRIRNPLASSLLLAAC